MLAVGLVLVGVVAKNWLGDGKVVGEGVWLVGGVCRDCCMVVAIPVWCSMERALGLWNEDGTVDMAWGREVGVATVDTWEFARELFRLRAGPVKVVMEGLEARTNVAGSRETEPVELFLGGTDCGGRNREGTPGRVVTVCCWRVEWFDVLNLVRSITLALLVDLMSPATAGTWPSNPELSVELLEVNSEEMVWE